ncbi:MAG TPA: alpha/beta fold hydrolase, partial [Symbiobacteriaceae bacterium]|jgi:pimeloyl-ACP methyl ester carboxylesterase|nr:alpha/beta fold hydrolase [Symbiobacteriaceae bacterium]
MPKTEPISISSETHGLAGNLVLPDGAAKEAPVPGVVIVGGPGPVPLERYSKEGAKNWPVLWTEALAGAGVAGLCYDQRGSGLSSGEYHEADWEMLYDDAKAAAEMLALQPEVGKTAALAWADGCGYALQLAAEGKVDAVVLLAPPYHTEEQRYISGIKDLAARKGLSDRVVQVRIGQWREGVMSTARRVEQGETTATVEMGGKEVTTNLLRFLQTVAFDPAAVVARVNAPALLLHGADDSAIRPAESEAMAGALPGPAERILYRDAAHFLYRHAPAVKDTAEWVRRVLG